jgi:hypothetical protein
MPEKFSNSCTPYLCGGANGAGGFHWLSAAVKKELPAFL